MAAPTVLTVKAATVPQITPIRTPRMLSPVHHSTPKPTNSVTTMNTTMDNITVAAILESILHPIFCVASVVSPSLFAAERSLTDNRSAAISLL
jgi:hypothetical protein